MKSSWYHRFLGVVVLLVVSVNLQAQSNDFLQNSDLKRKGFKLAINTQNETKSTVVLEKEQLRTMLSDEQLRSYRVARNCFVASIPLLSLAGYYTTIGSVFLGYGWYDGTLGGAIMIMASYVCFGSAFVCLVPGIVLMAHSAKRIDKVAESYNKQRHSSHFQNGLQVNFGLVDNGIGVKLRF